MNKPEQILIEGLEKITYKYDSDGCNIIAHNALKEYWKAVEKEDSNIYNHCKYCRYWPEDCHNCGWSKNGKRNYNGE